MKMKQKTKKILYWTVAGVFIIGGVVVAVKTGQLDKLGPIIKKIPVKVPANVMSKAGMSGAKLAMKFRKSYAKGDLWGCIGEKTSKYVSEGYDEDHALELASFE